VISLTATDNEEAEMAERRISRSTPNMPDVVLQYGANDTHLRLWAGLIFRGVAVPRSPHRNSERALRAASTAVALAVTLRRAHEWPDGSPDKRVEQPRPPCGSALLPAYQSETADASGTELP
jgi:hypothetical protein